MAFTTLNEDLARRLSAVALDAAQGAGASLTQVRIESIRDQYVGLRDGELET